MFPSCASDTFIFACLVGAPVVPGTLSLKPTTIVLRKGPPESLVDVETLTIVAGSDEVASVTSNASVPASLPSPSPVISSSTSVMNSPSLSTTSITTPETPKTTQKPDQPSTTSTSASVDRSSAASDVTVAGITPTTTQSGLQASDTSTAITPTPSSDKPNAGGLSAGAKASIGVGVSLACLILAISAFCLGIAVRKKNSRTPDKEGFSQVGIEKPELGGKEVHKHHITPEVDGRVVTATPPSHSTHIDIPKRPEELDCLFSIFSNFLIK
ncbi:hypothetical protein BU23DRAFT_567206 [Bimuria novae-zelandiae CBS 107.79]|uniref:Mid2 domain-containing protein n=1 Tax=Bimuria novae-zelandiae CBS 107.79 TaxID=1447943 RepID=A0A6A5VIC7_9PLEO|nr:hypothetical protein BU23DRAFT_567206 [Bimuria novae-zelandiae CBS 107.79]